MLITREILLEIDGPKLIDVQFLLVIFEDQGMAWFGHETQLLVVSVGAIGAHEIQGQKQPEKNLTGH